MNKILSCPLYQNNFTVRKYRYLIRHQIDSYLNYINKLFALYIDTAHWIKLDVR